MSLLQNLSYREYQKASALPLEQCELILQLTNLKIQFNESKKPGELLIKTLDRRGYSVEQYQQLLATAISTTIIRTYYKPQSKIAILIANDQYQHLSKLATPSLDCDSLGSRLNNLGFINVILKNTRTADLITVLDRIFNSIPENSYCFIFYAGHGCELCNTKCILDIECPLENITMDHSVTENYLLKEVAKCKPDLCVLIMDMCRLNLDRKTNPQIYKSIQLVEEYTIHNNLLISYSTQPLHAAYELLQIECSTTIDNDVTYELKPGDTDKIVPGASTYVNALCTRLEDNSDVSSLLDKVHLDVEQSTQKQRPIKVQCGVAKRSLYDPVTVLLSPLGKLARYQLAALDSVERRAKRLIGNELLVETNLQRLEHWRRVTCLSVLDRIHFGDTAALMNKLKDIGKTFKENCTVF